MGHPKAGGRQKGTPNKDKAALLELVRAEIDDDDYHPVVAMAKVAISDDEKITPELKFQAMKEVAQYIAPKRKAIEHSIGDEDSRIIFNMMFGVNETD
jgi:predicted transcriptional regulator